MKIKLDENIPTRLVDVLNRRGHETDTVSEEKIAGQIDDIVWSAAQKAGRFLITQDLDFSDIRRFKPGSHYGLLLVRLRDPGRNALLRRLQTIIGSEDIESWQGCFVVTTENKIRVRRPLKS